MIKSHLEAKEFLTSLTKRLEPRDLSRLPTGILGSVLTDYGEWVDILPLHQTNFDQDFTNM